MKLRKNPSSPDNKENFMRILVIKINSVDVVDHNLFSNLTNFDVEESKTYAEIIQGLHLAE